MISNAWVWKRELKKELKAFNKFLAKTNVRDAAGDDYLYLKLEKFFFTTSFIIRKLFESYKLSEELASINVPVERYKRIDIEKKINLFTNYDILRYYDVDNPAKSSLGAMKLCNCFIHSFNFAPVLDEESGKLVGVHINSDHDKDKFLYYIELKSFLKFVQEVIDDDIASTYYNPETGTYKRTRKMVLPPMPDGVKKLLEEHPDPMLREMLAGMYDIGTSS